MTNTTHNLASPPSTRPPSRLTSVQLSQILGRRLDVRHLGVSLRVHRDRLDDRALDVRANGRLKFGD